jgi:uncharacterized membrane protein
MMTDEQRRGELAKGLLSCGYEELNPVQKSVIDLIANEAPSGVAPALKVDGRTYWERLADRVAAVGGSWSFIFGFGAALFVWMGWNIFATGAHLAFDPYPFIFLNLMLSMLAAIQAPVIMMSQNRAAARDREAAEHDYVVNLRAELEIMHLHDKLDEMREQQMMQLLQQQGETLEILKREVAQLRRQGVAPAAAVAKAPRKRAPAKPA